MFYYLKTLNNDLSESQQRYDEFFATPLRQGALPEETVPWGSGSMPYLREKYGINTMESISYHVPNQGQLSKPYLQPCRNTAKG